MMVRLFALLCMSGLTLIPAPVDAQATAPIWPEVLPLHRWYTFADPGANDSDTPVLLFVLEARGDTAYRLECHNGNYDGGDIQINYSGDFQCSVYAWKRGRRVSGNLLADSTKDQQSSDWLFNRGRMLAVHLWGQCAEYPEFGPLRNFRFRRMILTLQFGNLRWVTAPGPSPKLGQFSVDVTVRLDERAQSEMTETPRELMPPRACGW
jgi:hypothetical protein